MLRTMDAIDTALMRRSLHLIREALASPYRKPQTWVGGMPFVEQMAAVCEVPPSEILAMAKEIEPGLYEFTF